MRIALLFLCLLLLTSFRPATAETPIADASIFTNVPDSAVVIELKPGEKRLSNQTHVFTTIPPQLAGLTAIAPHRGASTSEPGPAYEVTLTRPAALYLAVHKRGQPTVPEQWKPTGLTIGWGSHEDDVYARIAEPGTIEVPAHDGKAGGYGVPHMLIASSDLKAAQALIDQPAKRVSAIFRPARVMIVLPEPKQPGLYGHVGDEIRWKLRVVPGSDGTFPQSLQVAVQEEDGAFNWSTQVPLDATGHTAVLAVSPPRIGFYPLTITAEEGYELAPFSGGLGIVPEPNPTSFESPWGVMRVGRATFEAPLARMLGASWVRHTNWNMVVPRPGTPEGVDASQFYNLAKEFHDQGIHVMASVSMVPPALSSQQGNTSNSGDAGPLESRVAPRDWAVYQQFMRDTAAATADLIDYWEIGNEPNTPGHYWAGTIEEFADLVKYSVRGIREAKPDAVIITSGFTLNPSAGPYLDRLLELGVGDYFDILSVHSLYAKALSVDDMRKILAKHGLDPQMEVWSTEPKHVLAMRNFEEGVTKNMHFTLVNPGAYGAFQNLAERDGAATRWGVAYALASKLIDNAKYQRTIPTGLPDVELGLFHQGDGQLLAATADEGPRGSGIRVKVRASAGQTPLYTDLLGHELVVPPAGEFVMPLDRSGVLHGAAEIEILGVEVDQSLAGEPGLEVTADLAQLAQGFVPRSDDARPHYAVVYQPAGSPQPRIVFPFTLEDAGTYEFYVSAMWYPSHAGALVSPFSWSVDGKSPTLAPTSTTAHWRRSTRSHLRFGEVDPSQDAAITASQIFGKLGVVRNLAAGPHTLTLELQAPRAHDQHYSMEVELIAVRRITDDRE